MKKICLVIPSLQSGGMERAMSELASCFAETKGGELHLVLYGKSREAFYPVPDSVTIYRPHWAFNNNRRLLSTLRTLSWLRRTVKAIDPHTILSFGEYWNSFVLLALKGTRYPVYVSDRCQPDKYLGRLHERLRKWLYPGAAGIVAQTSQAKKIFEELLGHPNIRVIGNPIRPITGDGAPAEKENIILTVGRLITTKNHDRLIEIFARVNRDDWKLLIIGGNAIKQDGRARLKTMVEARGLRDSVILTGTVSDVEKYYLKSKIFAFTSSSEGFPNVIGEAMSAGLPVVSYDCVAGASDMIDDGKTGFLTETFDDLDFERKLNMLMESEDLRVKMGAASRDKIRMFAADRIGEQFYSFITGRQVTEKER